jgi:phage terminase Nu1 subunit (DNA packaging protein)
MDAMNKSQIADLFGVSLRTAHTWNANGWLVRSGRGYDAAASVRSATKASQAAALGNSNDSALVEANVAPRGRLARAQAISVDLRNKIAEGLDAARCQCRGAMGRDHGRDRPDSVRDIFVNLLDSAAKIAGPQQGKPR